MVFKTHYTMETTLKRFLLWSVVLILGIPTIVYFINFHGSLSDDPAVWGTFGDFLNPFVSVLNVAAFIYLTYIIQAYESRQERRKAVLPILINAMDDLMEMEPIALNIAQKETQSAGTFQDFKNKVDMFSRKYFTLLARFGISIEQLQDSFTALHSVVVLHQAQRGGSGGYTGLHLDVIPQAAHREHLKNAAATIALYHDILLSRIQE